MQFRVPRDKIRSTRREIRLVFSENDNITLTVRKFCSLLGKLDSFSGAVILAQLHLWPLHHLMRQQLVRATCKDGMHLNSQDHTDIRLNPKAFNMIDQRYEPHSVDLFST